MPLQFIRVSSKQRCPQCNSSDWCELGDRAALCMRVPSNHPAKNGGYYHFYGDSGFKPDFKPSRQPQNSPKINAGRLLSDWKAKYEQLAIPHYAGKLSVSYESLVRLGTVWNNSHKALAFPMYDGKYNPIGIRLRNMDGFKWSVKGSRNGLFVPPIVEPVRICYICEGPTSCAALLSLGFYAIGRPNNNSCNDMVKEFLTINHIYRAVIVVDNDSLKKFGRHEVRPGIQGAMKLKKELGIMSVWWIPDTVKDVREFVALGGTAAMIESDLNNKLWSKR